MRGFAKITVIALGLLVALIAFGVLSNMVAHPMRNRWWLSRARKRCGRTCDAEGVTAIVVCNGHLNDTVAQVEALLRAAACPQRVLVIVVQFCGSNKTVLDRMVESTAFRGVENDFDLAQHVYTIDGGPTPQGNLAAFGQALQAAVESKAAFTTFMAPCTAPSKHWDAVGVDQILQIERESAVNDDGANALLSYGVCDTDMDLPTYPVIGFAGEVPLVSWQKLVAVPKTALPSKLISSDFVFARTSVLQKMSAQRGKGQWTKMLREDMVCPPRCADILLTAMYAQAGVRVVQPTKLIVNGRASRNQEAYEAMLRTNRTAKARNGRTMGRVMDGLRSLSGSPFATQWLGVDFRTQFASKHALMGTLPQLNLSDYEVNAKYGSMQQYEQVWDTLRRRLGIRGKALVALESGSSPDVMSESTV